MVWPTEADLLDVLLRHRDFVKAALLEVACFAVVSTPLFLSVRRRRREPDVLRAKGCFWTAGAILVLNVIWAGTLFVYQWFR